MRAVTWQGKHKVEVMDVPDPEIVNPRDARSLLSRSAMPMPYGVGCRVPTMAIPGRDSVSRFPRT